MGVLKPVWTTSSFLIYLGGVTVLVSALVALSYLSGQYGDFAYVCWTLLVLVVLKAIALGFRRRGLWLTGGIFGFATVLAFAAFVAALWKWFGWLPIFESPPRRSRASTSACSRCCCSSSSRP